MHGVATSVLLMALSIGAAQAASAPPLVADGGKIGDGWKVVGLPKQSKPFTQFAAVRVGDRAAVRIEAKSSYGNLVYDVPAGATPPKTLRWSWRVDTGIPTADLKQKSGDDTPAKVCLSFDIPEEQLSFGERQKLRIARGVTGQDLPSATLCYLWDATLPVGTLMDNAFSRRIRQIVLRSGSDGLGQWRDEKRDVAADFKRAFGDESPTLAPLLAVIVGGDSDNTASNSLSYVTDLHLD